MSEEDKIQASLCVTCSAPTNIAVVKYWGKASVELNTPLNSNSSLTLDQKDLRAITTAAASKAFTKDELWLNGEEEDVAASKRLTTVFKLVRAIAGDKIDPATGEVIVKAEEWKDLKIRVCSRNTFPTAAGLASSAAGYACLTFTLAQLMNAQEEFPGQLTSIARQGSGSACRSLYGGFVKWQKSEGEDAKDSIGIQIADENHWPELRALILVVSSAKKGTSSTAGMSTSAATSELLAHRVSSIVEPRQKAIEKQAFLDRDFETFGEITMRDSNQFHSVCLDTYPPIFYMNDTSKNIIRLVHSFNDYHGKIVAAYTFDAGPNAVIYTTDAHIQQLLGCVLKAYRAPVNDRELEAQAWVSALSLPKGLDEATQTAALGAKLGGVQQIYATLIGGGPKVLDPEECMLDLHTGEPILSKCISQAKPCCWSWLGLGAMLEDRDQALRLVLGFAAAVSGLSLILTRHK
ncbi:unnamed protein product [Chrysoparadoxa australica]